LPVGAISEIVGPMSSGRTSLAVAFVAARTNEERVCAWVDAQDAFDCESAAASGVALNQLLWVRCRGAAHTASESGSRWARADYSYLDQALRATDLLLQAGGFAALVLDLGSAAAEHGARIPPAMWFRFRQTADRTRCSLLVLAREPLAQSSAAVVLECKARAATTRSQTVMSGCAYEVRTGQMRRGGAATQARTVSIADGQRKPPLTTWEADAAWQREAHA
jgi:hypothetical protein